MIDRHTQPTYSGTMTPTISDSERHARASLFEAGISDPSTALLRARLMLDHAKNARDLAHGWPSMLGVDSDDLATLDAAENAVFYLYTVLLRKERQAPPTINVSITRGGVTTNLATCRLDPPDELARVGLLAPWIEPNPIGFGTLTPFEREQTRRLAEATISYCETGCGEFAAESE